MKSDAKTTVPQPEQVFIGRVTNSETMAVSKRLRQLGAMLHQGFADLKPACAIRVRHFERHDSLPGFRLRFASHASFLRTP